MTTQTYLIPECNLPELEARIEKLNKRAVRLNVDPVIVTKTPDHVRYQVRQLTVNGETNLCWSKDREKVENPGTAFLANAFEFTGQVMAWWSVTVSGTTPTLSGWDFVAVLEPLALDDGTSENFVQNLPGQICPAEFRHAVGRCDHCNAARRRNQTFVVKNGDNYKCVGRQCLKDFLGYNGDPHAFASWSESLAELNGICSAAEDDEWLGGGGGYRENCWDLKHFLTLTACRVRLFGWVSRSVSRDSFGTKQATADVVLEILTPPTSMINRKDWEELVAEHVVSDEDAVLAETALEWAKEIPEADRNDFLANVNLVARVGTASRKTAGVAAAILVAYNKAMERETNRLKFAARPESNWIGEIGKRIQIIKVTCDKVIMNEGHYGVTGIHKMTDGSGNDLVWFASGGEVIKAGETVHVSATMKDHSEYRGRKQTVLSRVTVWTPEGVAEYEAKQARKAAREAKKAAKAAK